MVQEKPKKKRAPPKAKEPKAEKPAKKPKAEKPAKKEPKAKAEKPAKKERKKKDPNAPKKNLSAFMVFSNAERAKVHAPPSNELQSYFLSGLKYHDMRISCLHSLLAAQYSAKICSPCLTVTTE